MKLSPYRFDFGRIARLLMRPNLKLETLSKVDGPLDAAFPDSGLLHLPGALSPDECDQVVRDYEEFERLRERHNCVIRDENGRNYRLTNFHLKSETLLRMSLSSTFHAHASAFFGRQSAVYTSLFYKHGSQQDAHMDTPYFWTRPFNLFVGLWIALEDVRHSAGPLFYYPGSHRHFADESSLKAIYKRANKDLQRMFALMREEVEASLRRTELLLKKGDAVIWHPGILHGGTKATDPRATRYSAVFHLAPVGINVRDDAFPDDFLNLPTYGLVRRNGAYYCRGALPRVMI